MTANIGEGEDTMLENEYCVLHMTYSNSDIIQGVVFSSFVRWVIVSTLNLRLCLTTNSALLRVWCERRVMH